MTLDIAVERPDAPDIIALLTEHLRLMRSISPPESTHALDLDGLLAPAITFWTARRGGDLLGCGALKALGEAQGEVKSMHTAAASRGRGIAAAILAAILAEARSRGYRSLNLETGSQPEFAPAVRFYQRHGFTFCPPFADYREDPNSVFMSRGLEAC